VERKYTLGRLRHMDMNDIGAAEEVVFGLILVSLANARSSISMSVL
jgi:hypothetical protein